MICRHSAISFIKGHPTCLDCGTEFKNGELGKIIKERKENCEHELEYGYASNPPKAFCHKCLGYFNY